MSRFRSLCEKQFHLAQNQTNLHTEVLAGLTTFATMSYVLATIPNMLGNAGLPKGAALTALILLVMSCSIPDKRENIHQRRHRTVYRTHRLEIRRHHRGEQQQRARSGGPDHAQCAAVYDRVRCTSFSGGAEFSRQHDCFNSDRNAAWYSARCDHRAGQYVPSSCFC